MTTQDRIDILKKCLQSLNHEYLLFNDERNEEQVLSTQTQIKQWLAELEKQKELVNIVKSFVE